MLLGIDLGTTGVKLLVISENGDVLFKHFESYKLYVPKSGWVEEKPREWWKAILKSLKSATSALGPKAKDITAMALSGQMHTSVFLDRNGEVIRPAILWSDTRTFDQRKEIENHVGKTILLEKVQNLPLEGFTAPKILWLKENEPENYSKIWKILLPKDYINYKLTGKVFTEYTDASGTALFDVIHRMWSEEVIEKIGLAYDHFPEVVDSTAVIGKISKDIALETGINPNCVVVAGGADNACGATGAGVVKDGQVLVSIGSSGVVLIPTNDPDKHDPAGRLHFFNHVTGKWYNMAVTLSAGLSLKWFKENFCQEEIKDNRKENTIYDVLIKKAKDVPATSEGLLFLPYLNGERTPHMNAKIRGLFANVSIRHTKAHFIRSILEGVAYSLRDCVETMKEQGMKVEKVRVVGGGAKSKLWLQIVSDVLKVGIETLKTNEGPAFGAALIAGVGCGLYRNIGDAADTTVKISESTLPTENTQKYDQVYKLYKEFYESTHVLMEKSFDIGMK